MYSNYASPTLSQFITIIIAYFTSIHTSSKSIIPLKFQPKVSFYIPASKRGILSFFLNKKSVGYYLVIIKEVSKSTPMIFSVISKHKLLSTWLARVVAKNFVIYINYASHTSSFLLFFFLKLPSLETNLCVLVVGHLIHAVEVTYINCLLIFSMQASRFLRLFFFSLFGNQRREEIYEIFYSHDVQGHPRRAW